MELASWKLRRGRVSWRAADTALRRGLGSAWRLRAPALTQSPRAPAQTPGEPHRCCTGAGAGSESHYWSSRCWLPSVQQGGETGETQERVRREHVDQSGGTFPKPGPLGGEPAAPGARDLRATVIPSSAPSPDSSLSLSRTFRKAHAGDPRPRAWGLGPAPPEAGAARSRTGGWLHPRRPWLWTVKLGPALSSPGGSTRTFLEHDPGDGSPDSSGTGSGSGDPSTGGC